MHNINTKFYFYLAVTKNMILYRYHKFKRTISKLIFGVCKLQLVFAELIMIKTISYQEKYFILFFGYEKHRT